MAQYHDLKMNGQDLDERLDTVLENEQNIEEEAGRAQGAEGDLSAAIAGERSRAQVAEQALQGNINAEAAARQSADETVQGNINAEAAARQFADQALQGNIDDEELARQNADNSLQSGINAEASARQNADSVLQANIEAETLRATSAEDVLNADIEAIEARIPAAASAQNKLVDLQTMNSSIATATATFKGTYNIVTDFGLAVNASHSQIESALDANVTGADINDYLYLQIPESAADPSNIVKYERYKYSGAAWSFEFALNNSSFTASQWEAINSTITSGLVSKLRGLPSDQELIALFAGKQDVINDLATIRSNATRAYKKPVYGIPESDLDAETREKINNPGDAYHKPDGGIPESDLDSETQTKINAAGSAYQVPEGGIPASDLDTPTRRKVAAAENVEDKSYDPDYLSGLGKMYLPMNLHYAGLHFAGFVENKPTESFTLQEAPTEIVYDTANNRFLGVKGGKYYYDWVGPNSNSYVHPNDTLSFVCDDNCKCYAWDETEEELVDNPTADKVNILTQSMINNTNTIYIIQHDYEICDMVSGQSDHSTLVGNSYYGYLEFTPVVGVTYRALDGCVFIKIGNTNELKGSTLTIDEYDQDTYAIARQVPESQAAESVLDVAYYSKAAITVPANCVLQFEGGSIKSGTLVGNKTRLNYNRKLYDVISDVVLEGTFIYNEENPPIEYDGVDFDFVVTTQEEFNALPSRVNSSAKQVVNVLLKDNIFEVQNYAEITKSIKLYGDNATITAKSKRVHNYYKHSDSRYDYYDFSSFSNSDYALNHILISKDNDFIPYNYIQWEPESAILIDSTEKTAKIALPAGYDGLKNKNEAYFKSSYLRLHSLWSDAILRITHTDSEYIYFKYYEAGMIYGHPTDFLLYYNNLNYGYPKVRLYNTEFADNGAYLDTNKMMRVPKGTFVKRVAYGKLYWDINSPDSITIDGIKFVGTVFNTTGRGFGQLDFIFSLGKYNSLSNVDLTIRNCEFKCCCSPIIEKNIYRYKSVAIQNCRGTLLVTISRNIGSLGDLIFENNVFEGTKDNVLSTYGCVGLGCGNIDCNNNVLSNFEYDFISSSEIAWNELNIHHGRIVSNHCYNTRDFNESIDKFLLQDGGVIYVCHRSSDTFEIKDNVIHDTPILQGIYLDSDTSNVDATDNLIFNTVNGFNINHEYTITKTDQIPSNANLHLDYNILGAPSNLFSLSQQDATFNKNLIFTSVKTAWGTTDRRMNFAMADNAFIDAIVQGGYVYISDKYRARRGSLVSRFLSNINASVTGQTLAATSYRNVNNIRIKADNINAVSAPGTNEFWGLMNSYLALYCTFYAPLNDTFVSFDLECPFCGSKLRFTWVPSGYNPQKKWYVRELNSNPVNNVADVAVSTTYGEKIDTAVFYIKYSELGIYSPTDKVMYAINNLHTEQVVASGNTYKLVDSITNRMDVIVSVSNKRGANSSTVDFSATDQAYSLDVPQNPYRGMRAMVGETGNVKDVVFNGEYWVSSEGFTPVKTKGTTADRPVVQTRTRSGATLPTDARLVFKYFTYLNTSDNKYYINTSDISISWQEENTFAGKTIPSDVVRNGTTGQKPNDEYVYNNLYVGFEYYNSSTGYFEYVTLRERDGAGTTASPYTYRVEWKRRTYFKALSPFNDIGFRYFDTTIGKPIYLKEAYYGGGKWIEEDGAKAGVKRSGATADRPIGSSIYVSFMYLDTSLGKPIYASAISGDTVTWVDATGTTI